jgi:hypothetical protein
MVDQKPMITTSDNAALKQVRVLILALVIGALFGIVSLITDVTHWRIDSSESGTTTTLTHHSSLSRVLISVLTTFHVLLVVGIVKRRLLAWRAVLWLPAAWFGVGIISVIANIPKDPTLVIPLVLLVGMAIWQTCAWRSSWIRSKDLFH